MEQIKELEEVLELLNTKQYTKLRQYLDACLAPEA